MSSTAEIKLTASTKQLPSGLRQALKMVQGFVHSVTGLMNPNKGKNPDKSSIAFGSMIGNMAGQFAMRGIDKMVQLGHEVFEFNDHLTRFGIAARIGGVELLRVGSAIRSVSNDTGINSDEILRGTRAYVDLAGAANYSDEKMRTMARTSQAAGADIGDVASVVYALQHNLGIPDDQLENTLGGLINMSKDGAVHFAQMAQEFTALSPTFAQFGVKGREGAIKLAAQLQLARTGFGSASEAGTGLQRIMRALPQHAVLFAKAGVNVFKEGSDKELDTLDNIYKRIRESRLEQHRPALIKALGRGEAERVYQIIDGLLGEYKKLEDAGRVNGTVQEDLGTNMESATGRITQSIERMKNAFAEALTPERVDQIVSGIERIANSFPAVMDAVERVTDGFASLIYLARKARDGFSGMNTYLGNADDQSVRSQIGFESQSGVPSDPALIAKWNAIQERQKAYTQVMDSILAAESPTGITDASVTAAVINSRSTGMRPGQVAAREAANRYLSERTIPEPVMRRVRGRLDREEKADTDAAVRQRFNDGVRDAIKDGMLAAMKSDFFRPKMMVAIDGNPVATASGNASKHKSK
jgi:TP901 family phage tail tape measure protein